MAPFLVKVSAVAKRLGISPRRVRHLLTSGRMAGVKSPTGRWSVIWPLQITPGKRGPEMKSYPSRLFDNTE